MALSGTVNGKVTYLSSYYTYYFTWSAEQNIEENYSDVTVSTYWGHSGGYTFDTVSARSASITINGTKKSISKRFDYYPWVTDPIQTETVRVYHNDDGTKKITISTRSNGHADTYGPSASINSSDDCTASAEITLDTIPRPSTFSLDGDKKPGETQIITISKKNTAFKSKIEWTCGSKSGEIAASTSDTAVNWTVPLSLITQNPTGLQACTITLTTLDDSNKKVGSSVSQSFNVTNYEPTKISSISGDTIGNTITVNYTPNNNFTYKIEWAFVDDTWNDNGTSVSFTPTLDYCGPKIPNNTSGALKCRLTTSYSGTIIGTHTLNKTLNLASSVVPTLGTITIAPQNILTDSSYYIKNYSKMKIDLSSFAAAGGATIETVTVSVEGQKSDISSKTYTSNILKDNSYKKISIIATDSRGRIAQKDVDYQLIEYETPSFGDISVTRSSDLQSISISGKGSWMVLDGKNSATLSVKYKKASAASYTSSGNCFSEATESPKTFTTKTISSLDATASYIVMLTFQDEISKITKTYSLKGKLVSYDMNKNGLGIGKTLEQGALDIEGDIYLSGDIYNNNVPLPAVIEAGASDMDTFLTQGKHFNFYRADENTLNTPFAAGLVTLTKSLILSYANSQTYGKQVAFINGGGIYERRVVDGEIKSWVKILNDAGGTINGDLTVHGNLTAEKVFNAVWNDYAEFFPKGQEAEPGDIIALDLESDNEQYIKATKNNKAIVGVYSNEYGHILGGDNCSIEENMKNYIPVGLAGRVWVKVQGNPRKGDYIGASDIPGVGEVCDDKYNAIGICVDNNLKDGKCRIKII